MPVSKKDISPCPIDAMLSVVDGRWSTVGSANLDQLSLRQNLEVNAVIVDAQFGAAMQRLFDDDLRHCVPITRQTLLERSLFERLLSWCAYQVRRWL